MARSRETWNKPLNCCKNRSASGLEDSTPVTQIPGCHWPSLIFQNQAFLRSSHTDAQSYLCSNPVVQRKKVFWVPFSKWRNWGIGYCLCFPRLQSEDRFLSFSESPDLFLGTLHGGSDNIHALSGMSLSRNSKSLKNRQEAEHSTFQVN